MSTTETVTTGAPAEAPPSRKPELSEGARAERRLGFMLIAPAVIVMIAVTAYPFHAEILAALQNASVRPKTPAYQTVSIVISHHVSPPAGIDPLVVVSNNMSWSFLFAPVGIGAVLLTLFAFAWHNLVARGANKSDVWPVRWW